MNIKHCEICQAKITVEDPCEYTCYICNAKIRKKKKGEFSYYDMQKMGYRRKIVERMVKDGTIKPIRGHTAKQNFIFSLDDFIKIRGLYETYKKKRCGGF